MLEPHKVNSRQKASTNGFLMWRGFYQSRCREMPGHSKGSMGDLSGPGRDFFFVSSFCLAQPPTHSFFSIPGRRARHLHLGKPRLRESQMCGQRKADRACTHTWPQWFWASRLQQHARENCLLSLAGRGLPGVLRGAEGASTEVGCVYSYEGKGH